LWKVAARKLDQLDSVDTLEALRIPLIEVYAKRYQVWSTD